MLLSGIINTIVVSFSLEEGVDRKREALNLLDSPSF